jgi:hypothetical protein
LCFWSHEYPNAIGHWGDSNSRNCIHSL